MRLFFSLFLVLPCLLFSFGCGGARVPEELKNLTPVTITVLDGSTPIEGVAVTLSAAKQGAYACKGVTDAQGVAQIQSTRSDYTGNGVPAGEYVVSLVKSVELPEDLMPIESDQDLPASEASAKEAKRNDFLKKNQAIPNKLTLATISPVKMSVAGGTPAELTVDISTHR